MDNRIEAFGILHSIQAIFGSAERQIEDKTGKSICMSGCGKCCEVNTPKCMTIEAMDAISVLLGQGTLDKVASVAEGWLLERHNEAPTYNGMIVGGFVPADVNEERARLSKLPCPFLDSTKRCMIHSCRPFVCRAYGVTRTAVGFCPRPPGRGETQTQFVHVNVNGLKTVVDVFKRKYGAERVDWVTFGFLPTLIFRAAREEKFCEMVANNRIATAKTIGITLDETLLWQTQVELVNQGVAPDLVAI